MTAGSTPISPQAYQQMLGVGIDVNWAVFPKIMEAYKSARDQGVNIPLLFKKRGFSHVRIRVKDDSLDSLQKDNLTLKQQLVMVVNDCLEAHLIPVITFVATKFRENPNVQTMDDALKFWKEVATIFKNYPYVVSYDLIIETSGNISKHDDLLNKFYQKAVSEIRGIDKYRILFLSPNDTSNPYSLPKMWYPENDKYVMVEWHFYAAGPSKRNKSKLWTTGTDYEKNLILKKIKFAKKWCKFHGLYSWNGAWMPTNFNHAKNPAVMPDGAPMGDYSLQEEISFASFVSSSLKSAMIPYAINAGNKFFNYDDLEWYRSTAGVLNAVLK
ncbi:glycoside hydrolase family 5 protein [Mesoaciditoga lauensis]|uniref:glycoside hydrolase family 5 protein n=1 Tax=Mesoaciditoga lauensis TaxID=1495039 RepID=UPI000690798E|nr:cellulase family glycosylhydrolase [Mesoaciditoga lauensis]